jgi:hypothetical protein
MYGDELGRIWKDAVVATSRYYYCICLCTEENHETSQDSWRPGRNFNRTFPEKESERTVDHEESFLECDAV